MPLGCLSTFITRFLQLIDINEVPKKHKRKSNNSVHSKHSESIHDTHHDQNHLIFIWISSSHDDAIEKWPIVTQNSRLKSSTSAEIVPWLMMILKASRNWKGEIKVMGARFVLIHLTADGCALKNVRNEMAIGWNQFRSMIYILWRTYDFIPNEWMAWHVHAEVRSNAMNRINHGTKITAADGVADKHDDFLPATGKTIWNRARNIIAKKRKKPSMLS